MCSAANIFNALIGNWTVQREIRDRLTALIGTGIGSASIVRNDVNPNELLYSEETSVRWSNNSAGESSKATKLYKYALNGECLTKFDSVPTFDQSSSPTSAGGEGVRFEKMFDLRFEKDPNGGGRLHAEGTFQCGQDRYRAEYRFEPDLNRFRLTYDAQGPHKQFSSITQFVKIT